MKKIVYVGLIPLFVLALAGCQRFKKQPAAVIPPESTEIESAPEEIPESKVIVPDLGAQTLTGSYMDYDANTIAEIAKNNKTVLFFHATWCPDCKAINEEINSRIFELPGGVSIIKVDYDSQDELKQKYAITHQHTFVLVDENLEAVEKWNGGDLDQILSKVQ